MAEQTHALPLSAEPPLRAELFNVEQLAQHARGLAAEHEVVTSRGSNRLLAGLEENEEILTAFNRATLGVHQSRVVTPAAEWLLDNFYLIEEQIQMARRHLPRGYNRELPRLVRGPSAGFPRVYDLVLELISHTDAQIDAGSLSAFVAAYQVTTPLKLGELWAVPIMVRLGLIENLARVTTRLALARQEGDLAETWVDRLQAMAEKNPSHLVVIVADMAKADVPVSSAFVAEFCQRLSRQNPVLHLARGWLEQRLAEQGLSSEQLIHRESQNQAADQVSVSHSISSLRFLSAMNWKEFVETLSLVDQTLRHDPAGVYGAMDFSARDRYRHAVETCARYSELSEADVAQRAIQLAEAGAREKGRGDRTAHVGFYLIDKGQRELEQALTVHWPGRTVLERAIHRFPLTFYVGGIGLLTLVGAAGFLQAARGLEVHGARLVFFTLIFGLCVSQLAVALMNWLSTLLVKPGVLPRLDYSRGIAPEARTMVVVPTMLNSIEGVERLVEMLEIHYLANRDAHLHFGLVTDFRDAPAEVMPEDQVLLERVRAGIEGLNHRYQSDRSDIFFLFHRPRRWNAGEGLWMGYERKRGKLTEFNALLRGGSCECFSAIVGETSVLRAVQYVITLDTDTQLPRDSARRLVGTIAHPLNRPVFDPVRGIVTEGYGILQPRVGVSLPSAGRSWFARVFAGDAGIDPYTRAISDVYQDVFQEGSFIGKGIYDVDAFERAMAGRFPENAVLSHDLLEACHARSALVSDIELYEDYPSRYNVDIDRRHRWIRGDWQISPWLLPRVPGSEARRIANPLTGLSRWKIFDNLRRSLVPVALWLFLLGDWILVPELRGAGILLVLAIVMLPGFLAALCEALDKPVEMPWAMHVRAVAGALGRQFSQVFLTLVFLPYDAFISLDAVGRTWLRLLVTRKRLLEWRTSSEVERTARSNFASFLSTMWFAPVTALACFGFLAVKHPEQLVLAVPLLTVWTLSPWIAWWISQPILPPASDLSEAQVAFLHRTARKTWHFFETFVTAQENWLPPDNFQEHPAPIVASRTSPTNLGLGLLANLAACDFGYLSVGRLIRRTQDTFNTMQRLERHRGHFLNWYDTRTLQPLQPLYVSSVDSGNLAGHLLTLGAGLRELCDAKIFTPEIFAGLRDTLQIVQELAGKNSELARLDAELVKAPAGLAATFAVLERATGAAKRFVAALPADVGAELATWGRALAEGCEEHRAELLFLAPWMMATPVEATSRMSETSIARNTAPDLAPT
ncbi:MAG TPA: hypothetical protein VGA56_02370, partial [Opitutaceae bacterium]